MSIWKNENEAAYAGGKKHWADVIKNSGDGNLLIWRQPEEDFNTNSTLVVMPGEEAIFIKGGTIEQTFDNGTYKLSTENYPFISRLRNAFTGGVSTFSCVVYFVRKAHSMEILWGTDSPIQVRDKFLGIATKLKARGAYKIQIGNPAIFLEKLIGNNVPLAAQADLTLFFRNEFQSKIKTSIAKAANETTQELLGIDSRLDEFSDSITPFIEEIVVDYGLKLVKFTVAAIDIDDDELRRRYDEIGMDAIEKMRIAQADKSVMGILGEDWGRQQAATILKDLANNPGAGGVAAAGAGLGMGIGAGGVFGSMAQQIFSPMNPQPQQQQIQQQPSGRFTQKSVTDETPKENPVEKIKQLKEMLDLGAISQEEFETVKQEILNKLKQ
jgi:membrane protease subunit (stomatin/prohibitin family)